MHLRYEEAIVRHALTGKATAQTSPSPEIIETTTFFDLGLPIQKMIDVVNAKQPNAILVYGFNSNDLLLVRGASPCMRSLRLHVPESLGVSTRQLEQELLRNKSLATAREVVAVQAVYFLRTGSWINPTYSLRCGDRWDNDRSQTLVAVENNRLILGSSGFIDRIPHHGIAVLE